MTSVFKSAQGRDKVLTYYNQILSHFLYAQRYEDTSYGKTFMLEAGSAQNPAVVLLHGSCSNTAIWLGDIPALSQRFHVFAVDIPGEAGNSEETRPDLSLYPKWLSELLDVLKLDSAIIIGHSLGGWLALEFAAAYPQRTASLVLLAPSGIVEPNQSFLAESLDYINGGESGAAALSDKVMDDVPEPVRYFLNLIMENFTPITGALPSFTDEQMRALTMNVLMIAGEKDVTMNPVKAAQRLQNLVPHAKVKIIENGAHVIIGAMDTVIPFLLEKE
jgi:pimeloyl-ACP methyl ester carboxylesterase